MLLERVAPAHERRGDRVAELLIVEEQAPERLTVDRDVAHPLRDHRGHIDGLAGEQVQLAQEAMRFMAHDLVAVGIEDGRLAVDDRDERIRAVADAVQHVSDLGGALLAVRAQRLQLRVGEPGRKAAGHNAEFTPSDRRARRAARRRLCRARCAGCGPSTSRASVGPR